MSTREFIGHCIMVVVIVAIAMAVGGIIGSEWPTEQAALDNAGGMCYDGARWCYGDTADSETGRVNAVCLEVEDNYSGTFVAYTDKACVAPMGESLREDPGVVWSFSEGNVVLLKVDPRYNRDTVLNNVAEQIISCLEGEDNE